MSKTYISCAGRNDSLGKKSKIYINEVKLTGVINRLNIYFNENRN